MNGLVQLQLVGDGVPGSIVHILALVAIHFVAVVTILIMKPRLGCLGLYIQGMTGFFFDVLTLPINHFQHTVFGFFIVHDVQFFAFFLVQQHFFVLQRDNFFFLVGFRIRRGRLDIFFHGDFCGFVFHHGVFYFLFVVVHQRVVQSVLLLGRQCVVGLVWCTAFPTALNNQTTIDVIFGRS